ncbi:MAG: undecaprenyl-phosphate glucose phosphotransferase [Chromatiales bacterium]|nr:undecaprenyl-phosphate glucose phosphotransferase [Chromatiales bacterium]
MSVTGSENSLLEAFIDALIVLSGVIISCRWFLVGWDYTWSFIAVCGVGSYYAIAQSTHLYKSVRMTALRKELIHVVMTWCVAGLVIFVVALMNEPFHDNAYVLMAWFFVTLSFLLMWRSVLYVVLWEARRHGFNTRTVAIVGYNDLGVNLSRIIADAQWKGLEFSGFYEDRIPAPRRTADFSEGVIFGGIDLLHEHACAGKIDLIYITLPLRAEHRIRQIIEKLADSAISVYVVPGKFTYDMIHPQLTTMGEMPVIGVCETPFHGIKRFVKRAEDLLIGSFLFAIALIPMIIIGIAIKVNSPGPILFKQRRGGVNGEVITVWKFRTMTVCEDGREVQQATRNDERVTSVGRFLRRTSLDELPQIINVLQGDMSVVGPRPHALTHNTRYRPLIHRYMLRHKVKPGMTGWAQINGWRGETDLLTKMEKRIEFDLQYINNWSLLFDLKIVVLTPFTLLRNKDVY